MRPLVERMTLNLGEQVVFDRKCLLLVPGHTKIGKPLYFQSESYGMGITWQGNLNLDSPGPVSRGCQDGTWLGEMKPGNKPESIKYLSRSAFKAPDKPKQGHT